MTNELDVFTKHYSKLCDTLTDIDRLLPYFIEKNVIKHEDLDEINATVILAKKVQKLMTHISGPLRAGNTEGFYIMLRIMKKYGHQATQQLADNMRSFNNHSKLNTNYCKCFNLSCPCNQVHVYSYPINICIIVNYSIVIRI